jgi:hypothetical protein
MKRTTVRIFALLVVLGLASSLLATVDAQKQFVAAYPQVKGKLDKCTTCHTGTPKKGEPAMNAYGKDLFDKAFDKEKKTYDFKKVEGLDSDGDGKKNLDEINAGTNPGAK